MFLVSWRARSWTQRTLTAVVALLASLGCLEVVLRTLPVYGGTRTLPVNDENPIIRFEPNREFIWSRDWNFSIVNKVKVNNFGFVSDFDYDESGTAPLLAVIGDGYVEALMVPFAQTCAGRLATALDGTARVYAFGFSSSSLGQYLAFAEYARDTFGPDGLVIVIIENDYYQSLRKYGADAGKYQFIEQGDERLVLARTDFHVSPLRRLARASAVAMYLIGNVDVNGVKRSAPREHPPLVGREYRALGEKEGRLTREASRERARIADSERAVRAFLGMLPESSGLDPARIVFVVDGLRPDLYDDKALELARGSYVGVMRRYFVDNARKRGYETVDMQPVFAAGYGTRRERFEWPQDSHWNALGHEMCFDALTGSESLSMAVAGFQASGANREGHRYGKEPITSGRD